MFLSSKEPVYVTRPMPTEFTSPEQIQQMIIDNIRNQVAKQLEESNYAEAMATHPHVPEIIDDTIKGPEICLTQTTTQLPILQNTF